jgi:hypothetical protein
MLVHSRRVAWLAASVLVIAGCESVLGLSDLDFDGAGGGGAAAPTGTSAATSGASSTTGATSSSASSGTGGEGGASSGTGGEGGATSAGTGGQGGAGSGGDEGLSYADLVLGDAPVWYFRFEEGTGSIVAENLGSSPDDGFYFADAGTITWEVPGTLDREGQPGRAATFGNEARVIVEDSAAAQFAGDATFSFEMWLAQTEFGEFGSTPFRCRAEDGEPNGWLVYFSDVGIYIKHYGTDEGGVPASQGIPDAAVATSGMHHVVFVMNEERELRTYVDGALVVVDVPIDVSIAPHDAPATLGQVGGDGVTITIDEIAVYDRGLSGQEVQSHYFCGALGVCEEAD